MSCSALGPVPPAPSLQGEFWVKSQTSELPGTSPAVLNKSPHFSEPQGTLLNLGNDVYHLVLRVKKFKRDHVVKELCKQRGSPREEPGFKSSRCFYCTMPAVCLTTPGLTGLQPYLVLISDFQCLAIPIPTPQFTLELLPSLCPLQA